MEEENYEYVNEYLKLDEEYRLKYGEKVALFYLVGKFYQLYGTEERIKKIAYDDMGISYRRIKTSSTYTAGFPEQSLKKFKKVLLDANYIVIIYDQADNPKNKNKIRVFKEKCTAATFIDEEENYNSENQTILSIYIEYDQLLINNVEMCSYEPVSGQTTCYMTNTNIISDILLTINRIDAKQIVVYTDNYSGDVPELNKVFTFNNKVVTLRINKTPNEYKRIAFQNDFFSSLFSCGLLTGIEYIGLGQYPSTIICFILLLKYVEEFDSSFLHALSPPKLNNQLNTLHMSTNCMEQLNFFDRHHSSLFNILNNTSTVNGKKYLKFLLLNPSTNKDVINTSYNNIEKMISCYKEFETHLDSIHDIAKLHRRISIKKIEPYEFKFLVESYHHIIEILKLASFYNIILTEDIKEEEIVKLYNKCQELSNIDVKFKDDFISPLFKDKEDLNCLYLKLDTIKKEFEELEKIYNNTAGKIKLDITEKSKIYTFHVNEKQKGLLSKIDDKLEFTKKASGYRMTSNKIRELSESATLIQDQINKLTCFYYFQFLEDLNKDYNFLFNITLNFINNIDVIKSNAKTSVLYKYCKPVLKDVDKGFINSTKLRHPIIEKVNTLTPFIPNDCQIGDEHDGILLFGLNFSGKSSYMKSVGIALIMAQAGMYVPAESFTFNIYKKIGIKMTGGDNIYGNKSLFVNEVLKIKEFISMADKYTLILGDELANGTEYYSQSALIESFIDRLASVRCSFILTTHLHELSNLNLIKNIKLSHMSVTILPDKMVYDRVIKDGPSPQLYGIEIANFLGLDSSFISKSFKFRNLLLSNKTEYKESHFNKEVIVKECTMCKSKMGLETHHIIPQHQFNQPFSKNIQHNLAVLCETCHLATHHSSKKILGYIQTSNGVELQYED